MKPVGFPKAANRPWPIALGFASLQNPQGFFVFAFPLSPLPSPRKRERRLTVQR